MSQQIAIRIPDGYLAAVDALVEQGRFPNRAAAVRAALEGFLRAERELQIAEEYRRGYGAQPSEEWVGAAGLTLGAEAVRSEHLRRRRR